MTILLVAGSPSAQSRSGALLQHIGAALAAQDVEVDELQVRILPAQALIDADATHPAIAAAIAQVARSQAIVFATPIYKAAYSGALKVFLDLLPQNALAGKRVLPLATGGSAHHMLALDYALRPVLQSLAAQHVLSGVYATDAQFTKDDDTYRVSLETVARLDDAITALLPVRRSVAAVAAERFEFASIGNVLAARCPV
jgi:FMN reductase